MSSWRRKLQDALSGNKNLTKGQKIFTGITMLMLLYAGGFMGYIYGYQDGTGMFPFGPTDAKSVRPAMMESPLTDLNTVKEFIKSDETDLRQYGVGFNSAEFGLLLARNAHWQGVPAQLVRLDFVDSETSHMVLAFPTTDAGWVFIEPQSDDMIYPRIGGHWLNKKIEAMWLFDPNRAWVSFEEFVGK